MNQWLEYKKYANSHEYFTRKELKENSLHGNTIDNYINLTAKSGFIKKTGRGQYTRILKIPNFISSSLILKLSYDKEKREKILITIIRKEKLENIRNQS